MPGKLPGPTFFIFQVTDTPGIFDTYPDTESVDREFLKTVCLASPGPHAILHVVRADCRFTREDYFMYEDMKSMFGESLTRFLILVFNGISQKDFEEKYKEISCLPADLLRIMHEAGGRMACFSDTRTNTSSRNEVEKLLSSIQNLKKHNNGAFHSNENFRCVHEKMLQKLGNSDIKIHEIKRSMAEERDLWFLE